MSNETSNFTGRDYRINVSENPNAIGNVLRGLSNTGQPTVEVKVDSIVRVESAETLSKLPFKKGVYVFQRRSVGEVLYVGMAGFEAKQTLAKRVKQQMGTSSGASFRINWAKCHCSCQDKNCSGTGDACFQRYKELIGDSRIVLFCICNKASASLFEHVLGCCLRSKYSSH